jgi:hypothetical protein
VPKFRRGALVKFKILLALPLGAAMFMTAMKVVSHLSATGVLG